jgi:DNA-binding CsgD family transcriptional regulator
MRWVDRHLVGRGPELAELARSATGAATGGGAVLVVSGEAGIGKTTMLEHLAMSAAAAGMPVLAGRADADEGAPAFWPWRRAFARAGTLGLDLAPNLLETDAGPPAQARFVAVARAAAALLDVVPPTGLLLTLDDMQWADEASLALLRHVALDVAGSRLLLAVATRDSAALGPTVGLPVTRAIPLSPLTAEDVVAYLRDRTEGPVDRAWAGRVHRASGGNPLFVRELVRAGPGPDDDPVPESVRALAGGRLDLVGASCRRLLAVAALLGDEVDVTLLRAVLGDTGGLSEAVAAGILVDDPELPHRSRFSHALVRQAIYERIPRAERIAWHARAADALEATPDAAGRAGDIARHRVRAAQDGPSCRAAVRACRTAAEVAIRRGDHADAAHWHRRAIELATGAGLGSGEQADLLLGLAEAEFLEVRVDAAIRHSVAAADLAAGLPAGPVRDALMVRAALAVRDVGGDGPNTAIADLCRRAGDLSGGAEHPQILAQHAMALAQLATQGSAAGAFDEARRLAARAMTVAEGDGDAAAQVDALRAAAAVAGGPDGLADGRIRLGMRLRVLGPVARRPEAELWSHLWCIDGLLGAGDVGGADREMASLAALADRSGWPVARWHLLRARAARAVQEGRYAEAMAHAEAGRELADRCGDPSMYGQYYSYLLNVGRRTGRYGGEVPDLAGVAVADPRPILLAVAAESSQAAGDDDTARALSARLAPMLPALPDDIQRPAILAIAGELAGAFGGVDVVGSCYRALLPFANIYHASTYGYRGTFARSLGVLAAALGDRAAAIRHLEAAAEMEQRVGARGELAIVRLTLADLVYGGGDAARATELARQALRTAHRLGMAPTVAAASALLATLGGVGPDVLASLTARERDVASLIAEGRPNRAIADQLGLSERTVETHVRNLMTKLGLANRTQIAAWTLRAGLRS